MKFFFLLTACFLLFFSTIPYSQGAETSVSEISPSTSSLIALDNWLYQAGTQRGLDFSRVGDSQWEKVNLHDNSSDKLHRSTNYWLRHKILIADPFLQNQILAVFYEKIRSANKLYWDGVKLYDNGETGTEFEKEQPGKIRALIKIPRHLTEPGEHVIALHVSNQHFSDRKYSDMSIGIGFYDSLLNKLHQSNNTKIFIIGVFLTAAIFNIVFFFGFNKRLAFLFLAAYCLIHIVKVSLVYFVRYSPNMTILAYDGNVHFMEISAYLGSLFLLAFLLGNFSIPRPRQWLLILVVITIFAYILQLKSGYILLSVVLAFLISAYAVLKKITGALFSLIGLSGYSFFTYLGNQQVLEFGYFVGIIFFIICMTLSFGLQIVRQSSDYQQAILHSARLENELLKKNIQPHFIMNSLMSLQELLVKSPSDAGEFINALAEEFRIFSQAAGKKLISIKDELAICNAHLKIMGWRKNSGFTLQTHGISGDEFIPPAVFHTLIENGITHGYEKKREGRFVLRKEKLDFGTRYTLFNDGEIGENTGDSGTGSKYVESRLQESYPGSWAMRSSAVDNGWKVQIDIYHRPES